MIPTPRGDYHIKILVFDVETTTHDKGTPFSKYNKLVVIGWKCLWKNDGVQVRYVDTLYEDFLDDLNECTDLVGFNIKFDLHWLRSLGIKSFSSKRIWDCQLGEYILSRQQWVYPSLSESCSRRGGDAKIDVVKEEYWEKGINTDKIPREILTEYLTNDVSITEWLMNEQMKDFRDNPGMFKVFRLSCDDLKVLEEMEANGMQVDVDLCNKRLEEVNNKIAETEAKLAQFANGHDINWDSGDDLSTILFGGHLIREVKVIDGFYKSGVNRGNPKYKKEVAYIDFPQMFAPQKDWEVKKTKEKSDFELGLAHKPRMYFTNDEVLSKIKDTSGIIQMLKDRATYTKIKEYYEKLPTLIQEKGWEPNMIHGKFNQVVARTGRLSSSDPNLQNFAGEVQDVLVSRF